MTELIARIAGPYLLVTGLGFVFSSSFYARMIAGQGNADPVLLNLSGAVHFVIGMVILVNHFAWSAVDQVVVTLVGVGALVKGVSLILVPDLTVKSPKVGTAGLRLSAVGFVAVGLYLSRVGYL